MKIIRNSEEEENFILKLCVRCGSHLIIQDLEIYILVVIELSSFHYLKIWKLEQNNLWLWLMCCASTSYTGHIF